MDNEENRFILDKLGFNLPADRIPDIRREVKEEVKEEKEEKKKKEFDILTALQICGYKDIVKLSYGGFGDVYKCKRADTNTEVAIKHIKVFNIYNIRELIAMAHLHHPNIMYFNKILSLCAPSSRPWLAIEMDLAKGSYHRKYLDEKESKSVLSALAFCHLHNILHLDLKELNILDTASGPRISDFGLSFFLEPGQIIQSYQDFYSGTTQYMDALSIKQRNKFDREVQPSYDMWSFGATIFSSCGGNTKFLVGTNEVQRRVNKLVSELSDKEPLKLTNTHKTILERCLIVDNDKRITSKDLCKELGVEIEPPGSEFKQPRTKDLEKVDFSRNLVKKLFINCISYIHAVWEIPENHKWLFDLASLIYFSYDPEADFKTQVLAISIIIYNCHNMERRKIEYFNSIRGKNKANHQLHFLMRDPKTKRNVTDQIVRILEKTGGLVINNYLYEHCKTDKDVEICINDILTEPENYVFLDYSKIKDVLTNNVERVRIRSDIVDLAIAYIAKMKV